MSTSRFPSEVVVWDRVCMIHWWQAHSSSFLYVGSVLARVWQRGVIKGGHLLLAYNFTYEQNACVQ